MSKKFARIISFLLAIVTVLSLLPVRETEAASLKQGSSGTQVKYLQKNLIGLGYLSGTADGSFGSATKAAVKGFQREYGLSVDGKAGVATQTAVRNAIIRLQVELKDAGFNPGSADGHFGGKTREAVRALQKAYGLKQTGVADKSVWKVINKLSGGIRAGSSLKKGSSGTQVKYLQMALIGLGYLDGTADGKFGGKTREAVRKYQKAYGLGVDGSAGADTMTSIKNTIVTLQSDLTRKGFACGGCDSIYGSGMKSAVKAYQRYVGVAITGVAGPKTMVKLYGYSLGGSDSSQDSDTYKISIDSLYQDADYSKIWYSNNGRKSTTVKQSGCGGVALAMALNALLDTSKYDGQNVMQWFADNGYYYGSGTAQSGIWRYPRKLGLESLYCDTADDLISNLKKGRLAVALIKDKSGDEFFTYSGSKGHYILVSGYRRKDGVDQVFVNNPLSWMSSKWFDVEDLMDNVCNDWQGYDNSFVVIYE